MMIVTKDNCSGNKQPVLASRYDDARCGSELLHPLPELIIAGDETPRLGECVAEPGDDAEVRRGTGLTNRACAD